MKGRALTHKERGLQARGAFGLLEPVLPQAVHHHRKGLGYRFHRSTFLPAPRLPTSRHRGAKLRRGGTHNAPRPFLFRLQINDVHLSILRAEINCTGAFACRKKLSLVRKMGVATAKT